MTVITNVCVLYKKSIQCPQYKIYIDISGMALDGEPDVISTLASQSGLPPTETTFASLLQDKGYATALIGEYFQHWLFLYVVPYNDQETIW